MSGESWPDTNGTDPLGPFKYDLWAAYVGADDIEAVKADNDNTIDAWEAYGHINERQTLILRQYNEYCRSRAKVNRKFRGGERS